MVQKMFARASILLHNVGNQSEVAFDKDVPGLQVSLGGPLQQMLLFFLGKWFWETAGLQLQGVQ